MLQKVEQSLPVTGQVADGEEPAHKTINCMPLTIASHIILPAISGQTTESGPLDSSGRYRLLFVDSECWLPAHQ